MKLYFIHGAGCLSNNCSVANSLDNLFQEDLLRLSYYTDETFETIRDSLITQIEDNTIDNKTIFIGESYGGFWAAQMAMYFNAYCYLLNPAIIPYFMMKQFNGMVLQSNRAPLTMKSILSTKAALDPRDHLSKSQMKVMLGRNDTLIDSNVSNFYFTNYDIDWTNDNHEISLPSSFQLIVQRVNEF